MRTEIRTAIILGGAIVVGVAAMSIIFSTLETQPNTTLNINNESDSKTQSIDKSRFKNAPKLDGISGYINTTPEELEKEMEGKIILYDIWTYSFILSHRRIYKKSWQGQSKCFIIDKSRC